MRTMQQSLQHYRCAWVNPPSPGDKSPRLKIIVFYMKNHIFPMKIYDFEAQNWKCVLLVNSQRKHAVGRYPGNPPWRIPPWRSSSRRSSSLEELLQKELLLEELLQEESGGPKVAISALEASYFFVSPAMAQDFRGHDPGPWPRAMARGHGPGAMAQVQGFGAWHWVMAQSPRGHGPGPRPWAMAL